MSAKHTPGPWIATSGETTGKKVVSLSAIKAKRNVAHVGGPDREANAHLIAAAPELLEALKDMWAEATGNVTAKSCGHPYTCTCIGPKVRAAIAKAEGGTQ